MLSPAHPTASTLPLMITAWWPMRGGCCRSPWATTWAWVNWWTATLTWGMRPDEPTLATRC